jgi:hypothetical protein
MALGNPEPAVKVKQGISTAQLEAVAKICQAWVRSSLV